MLKPAVSVLMPIYNTKEEFLREAISSILSQTFTDFEFLILNDSPDNTKLDNIVKSFHDKRIRYYKNKKNLGISRSRNKLIELAKGEFLAIFDHDDVSLPDRLEKQVSFLNAHPEIGVCGSAYSWIHKNKIKINPESSRNIEKALMCGCAIHHSSAMLRKSVLIKNNIKYESKYSPAEDYALWCRLIGKTKFYNVRDILVSYRKHSNQTSQLQKNEMEKATKLIHEFVRAEHPDIWDNVQNNAMSIVRVKLFGFIPIAKFRHIGLRYDGLLSHIPLITIKTKMAVTK